MSHHYVQYESLNRCVFRRLLNAVSVSDDRLIGIVWLNVGSEMILANQLIGTGTSKTKYNNNQVSTQRKSKAQLMKTIQYAKLNLK